MALDVYIECDHANCVARSRDIWLGDVGQLALAFCGHHGDALALALRAQHFTPIDEREKVA